MLRLPAGRGLTGAGAHRAALQLCPGGSGRGPSGVASGQSFEAKHTGLADGRMWDVGCKRGTGASSPASFDPAVRVKEVLSSECEALGAGKVVSKWARGAQEDSERAKGTAQAKAWAEAALSGSPAASGTPCTSVVLQQDAGCLWKPGDCLQGTVVQDKLPQAIALSLIHAHCALKHVPMGPVPSSLPREPWGQGGQQCCHCGGGAGGTAAHVGASPAFSLGTTWSRASHVTSLLRLSYL